MTQLKFEGKRLKEKARKRWEEQKQQVAYLIITNPHTPGQQSWEPIGQTLFQACWFWPCLSSDTDLASLGFNPTSTRLLRSWGTPLAELNEDFNRIAPISMFYRNTSNSIEEITQKIREFYFGDHPINNETVYAAVDMFTDNVMLSGTDEAVKKHRKSASSPIFYYYFDYKGTNTFASLLGDASLHDYGVSHCDDLQYLFPFGALFPGIMLSHEDERMIDVMTTLWTNFAATGSPDRYSDLDLPILGSLAQHETSTLANYATEA
ncbi:unnamed protein product, partial [Timema podura]|nr:unnamed protein product [Timema podura]